jgi:hypothetical protein
MQSTETWKPVRGHENYYLVSDLGRVWSLRSQRVIRASSMRRGYASVTLSVDGIRLQAPLHRLVAEAFPSGEGPVVRHLDGDKSNNSASNLRFGTTLENAQDTTEHGTHRNTRKIVCHKGHDLAEATVDNLNRRVCQECVRLRCAALLVRIQAGGLSHATTASYRYGCRCAECVAFHSRYQKDIRAARKARQNA